MSLTDTDLFHSLQNLLDVDIPGLTLDERRRLVEQALLGATASQSERTRIVPVSFMTGRRPVLEARIPGLGSSDNAAILDPEYSEGNRTYVLFEVTGDPAALQAEQAVVEARLFFTGIEGSLEPTPIPGWNWRPIPLQRFALNDRKEAVVKDTTWMEHTGRFVLAFDPEVDFRPVDGSLEALGDALRELATDGEKDPYSFGHFYTQTIKCELRLRTPGRLLSTASVPITVTDKQRMGSMYQRIIERVIQPDTERQFAAAGIAEPDCRFHPWYPVLHIGSDKARLYTRALTGDIIYKKGHLTDPLWLLKVGLYLEFLTCLGIFEVVKDDLGDVLTAAERRVLDTHPGFTQIRKRINPAGWKKVWDMRGILFRKTAIPQTGPVVASNLLQKKEATLGFLETHHDDLKHAIALSGPNLVNAQETWNRVFRDAERAVLRKTPDAFPELGHLSASIREFALWHRKGTPILGVPSWMTALFGDQDGLYASACNQYRESMNEVADWAEVRGLMEFTGHECVLPQVSLMLSHMNGRQKQLATLQYRDGYEDSLAIQELSTAGPMLAPAEVETLLGNVELFRALNPAEQTRLAASVRPILLGPMERILIEGRPGTSLFIIAEGDFEVFQQRPDGSDHLVAALSPGMVIGEMSLLTGAPRSATVRAGEAGGTVIEIGKLQYEPLIKERPEMIDNLAALMAKRQLADPDAVSETTLLREETTLGRRIRRFLLGV